jgi:glycosyltransferase involved in cell wall biosynthesis
MSKLRLSIVIPFYNVEKYISQCLDSVYAQDIAESEYEVICVNDCSPDNSREIVLAYQHSHSNLILLEHEKNKMLGAARNTGLRAARGKYVWFIDSDDYIKENVFGKLLSIAEENELEILHFNAQRITDEGKVLDYPCFFPKETDVMTGVDYLNDATVSYWGKPVTAWIKIYKREFLLANQLFYPENVYFEDNLHTLNSFLVCKCFKYITDIIYNYRIRENSITETDIYSGIKLADRIHYCCDCINLLDGLPQTAVIRKDVYIYIFLSKKVILYLSTKEKWLFCKKTSTFDRNTLSKYLRFKDRFIYQYPFVMFGLSIIPFFVLRPLRKFKRMIMN